MSVGDITSDERGSGARFNDGKIEMHQIPWWVLENLRGVMPRTPGQATVTDVLILLGRWQRGVGVALEEATVCLMDVLDERRPFPDHECPMGDRIPSYVMDGVARVLMYGARKYKRGNWAKGMKWSVVMDCALRHLVADVEAWDSQDQESKLPHLDHALCNLIFLLAYRELYPEGDDRITEFQVKVLS